jgi:hypothetical protein
VIRTKLSAKGSGMSRSEILVLKRGRGRPLGSRNIDKNQKDLFPIEKTLAQFGIRAFKP